MMKRGDSRKNALPGEENLAQLLQEAASIPPVDTMIAAIARVHDLIVLASDSDFSRIPHLNVDNWLNSP